MNRFFLKRSSAPAQHFRIPIEQRDERSDVRCQRWREGGRRFESRIARQEPKQNAVKVKVAVSFFGVFSFVVDRPWAREE